MSHGFGITKQPDSCSERNFAVRDVCVDLMLQPYTCSGEGAVLRKGKRRSSARTPKRKREITARRHVRPGVYTGARNQARAPRLLFVAIRFPDLPQRAVGAVNRIVIGDWQSCDRAIGFWPFARQTAKQIPLASIRVSSHNAEIRARTDVVMRDTCRNDN